MVDKDHQARLSLCMIVRNEGRMLADCLESAMPVVHEMIVVDTGSTDETIAIAQARGARVIRHPWHDNFSEARNVSLAAATGEWALWLDADERLRSADYPDVRVCIRRDDIHAYMVRVENVTPDGSHVIRAHRLFRRIDGVRFSGRIHEQISPSLRALRLRAGEAGFVIQHIGYNQNAEALQIKWQRNLRLLRAQAAANPRDSYAQFNLAQTLFLMDRVSEAEAALRAALGLGGLPAEFRATIHNNLAECRLKRKDPDSALRHCRASINIVRRQLTARVMAYRAHRMRGDFESALAELVDVERMLGQKGASPSVAIEIQPRFGDVQRAMGYCLMNLNRYQEAMRHFRRALADEPNHAGALAALARCSLALENHEEARQYVAIALRTAPDDMGLLDLHAFLLLKAGRLEEAAAAMEAMLARRSDDVQLARRLAGTLVRLNRREDASRIMAAVASAASTSGSDAPVTDACQL